MSNLRSLSRFAGTVDAPDSDHDVGDTPCFCSGTLILTERGEVPVEVLAIGARLVTRDGLAKPIKWIGHRSYVGGLAADNPRVLPVCFKPGALSDGVPRRALRVSPEHALYLDGMLVRAELLVNGVSIVKAASIDAVHYFHVELDAHDLIVAEGAWTETFADDGRRGLFDNAGEFHRLYPDAGREPVRYCAPRVDEGSRLQRLHRRLAGRARRMGPDGAAPMAVLHGHLEVVGITRIAGWARAVAAPEVPVALTILADGVELGQVVADRYRHDLAAAGIGDGRHAFEFTIPGDLAAGIRHKIEVYAADDGTPLPGSPAMLEPAAERPEGGKDGHDAPEVTLGDLLGNLDDANRLRIRGWAQNSSDRERPVGLAVTVNGQLVGRVLANRYRDDLKGINSGRLGFDLVLPTPLSSLAPQEIHIVREADGAELPGSPVTLPAPTWLEMLKQSLNDTLARVAEADEERVLTMLTQEADRLLTRHAERQSGSAEREALRLFRRRWGGRAETAGFGPAAEGSRVLVIDAQIPGATRDAGSLAILSHIRALRNLGYAVNFAAADQMHHGVALAQIAGVTCCGAPFYSCVEDILYRQAGNFELVYLYRGNIADRYLTLVKRYDPKARILYSIGDLHCRRVAGQAEIEQRPELLAHSRYLATLETAAARRADIVVTHSSVDAEFLQQAIGPAGAAKIHVVPFEVPLRPPRKPFTERRGVGFLGSAGDAPNCDALDYLAREIMPLVWQVDPKISCKIVDHGWHVDRLPPFDSRIEIVGMVDDLDCLLDSVRLTVAALRFGAGINGEVIDSFAAGLPCAMTPVAAEGLRLTGPLSELVGDNPSVLAKVILRMHGEMAANAQAGEMAARLVASEFCAGRVVEALATALSAGSIPA